MPNLFVVPIEPIEERYSTQWLKWFKKELEQADVFKSVIYVDPKPISEEISNGEFLDVTGTNYYKASQLQILMTYLHTGAIQKGDIIFFLDYWFPGVEMLAYVRDGMNLGFKIAGCLHAGTWDPEDFLSHKGMERWARNVEQSWLDIADLIFVATDFHRHLIRSARDVTPGKIKVTGFPLYEETINPNGYHPGDQRKTLTVVFPHRLAPEKDPELFDALKQEWRRESNQGNFPNVKSFKFIKTKDNYQGKANYYDILKSSIFAISFAKQETWGIAMQEAVLCGCIPIVPDRLSYSELYLDCFKYTAQLGANGSTKRSMILSNVLQRMKNFWATDSMYLQEKWKAQKYLIKQKGEAAIPLMIQHLLQDLQR